LNQSGKKAKQTAGQPMIDSLPFARFALSLLSNKKHGIGKKQLAVLPEAAE
jgi:hypothetical protein